MLSVLTRVMDISGKTHLEDVWPGIEVFFHGGVSFTPYREQYRQLITQPGMHYMETYNASEGFFGLQTDLQDRAMLLMIDYGIFYESSRWTKSTAKLRTLYRYGELKPAKNYAVVISTSAGLWRYMIGDNREIHAEEPL